MRSDRFGPLAEEPFGADATAAWRLNVVLSFLARVGLSDWLRDAKNRNAAQSMALRR